MQFSEGLKNPPNPTTHHSRPLSLSLFEKNLCGAAPLPGVQDDQNTDLTTGRILLFHYEAALASLTGRDSAAPVYPVLTGAAGGGSEPAWALQAAQVLTRCCPP